MLAEKANYLADAGNEVTILTFHQRGRFPFFPLRDSVRLVDVDTNINLPFLKPLYRRRLRKFILENKPDVCISLCGRDLGVLAGMDGLPCIRMAEFHFSYESFRIRRRSGQLRRMSKAVSKLDWFVVLTREDMQAWTGVTSRISQIYNPSPFDREERAPLERRHCICAGRLEAQKNYCDLVKAWALVNRKHPDWVLDIYGSGSQEKDIRALIRNLSLEDSIKIHKPVAHIQEKMLESSILLMTSIYEGFPMVLLESFSIGLPAVFYACPCGPSEIIENGRDGFIVGVNDIEGFAAKVCEVMESTPLRKSMGEAAFTKSAGFSKEAVMPQWTELLSKLIQNRL